MGTETRLLFIDRDPLLCEVVADALAAKSGMEVFSAGGFQRAETLRHPEPLNVLVADVSITDIGSASGKPFIARFVARHPAAGFVLISADPVLYTQFYPTYAVCLQKPYDTDQLAQAITDAQDRVPTAV